MPKGKIKTWNEAEDTLLIENAPKMTVPELTQIIDASDSQIRYRCQKFNLIPKPIYKTWTIQDLQIATSNPRKIACQILGRNENSINSRIQYFRRQLQQQ